MTNYILHGGAARRESENNKKFFTEIIKTLPNPASMLIVCFAKPKEDWEEIFKAVTQTFSFIEPQKILHLKLASEDTDILTKQIKDTEAIYMLGGDSHKLQSYLEKVPDLTNLWKDKTVAGSSAGALVLSKYYYENDDDTYNEGLGILPFKLFCHYTEGNSDKLEKLKNFGEDLEVCTISDEKFFIINSG